MFYTSKKRITIELVLFGLLAFSWAALLTPRFAARYLSPDQVVSTAGAAGLATVRILLAILGPLLVLLGAIIGLLEAQQFTDLTARLRNLAAREAPMAAIIFMAGAALRLFHLLIAGLDSPYEYGGLFLEFADQIIKNGFLLPDNIPFYTNGGIPFAYPPLAFYVEALVIRYLRVPPFAAVNILPPATAILSMAAFYVLARASGLSRPPRLLALGVFAVLPNAFVDQIQGGGLAEAFGTLALVLFLAAIFTFWRFNTYAHSMLVGLTWALCVVSSPGSAYASVFCVSVLALALWVKSRSPRGLLPLVAAGCIALAVSSPYWLTVVRNHGPGVLGNSLGAQHHVAALSGRIQAVLNLRLVTDFLSNTWNLVIFLGVFFCLIGRRFFLLAMFLVVALAPREATWMLAAPAALVVGSGAEILLGLQLNRAGLTRSKAFLGSSAIFLLWLAVGPLFASLVAPFASDATLEAPYLQAMQWLQLNTAPESKVVVVSRSQVHEWVPQVSQRTVINMPYGAEWQPDEMAAIEKFEAIRATCVDVECLMRHTQALLGVQQFILFIDKERLDVLEMNSPADAKLPLLWENDKVAILTASAR